MATLPAAPTDSKRQEEQEDTAKNIGKAEEFTPEQIAKTEDEV